MLCVYSTVGNPCEKQHCDYMCVLTYDSTHAACICQDGKPVEPNTVCPKNANDRMTVTSQISNMKSRHTRHEGGIYSTIIVAVLVLGTLLGVYYFYQKYRLKLSALDPRYVSNLLDLFKNRFLSVL